MERVLEFLMQYSHVFKGLGIALGVYLILRAFRIVFSKVILNLTGKMKVKHGIDDKIVNAFKLPAKYMYSSVAVYISIRIFISIGLGIKLGPESVDFINNILGTIIVICLTYGVYSLTLEKSELFEIFRKRFEIKVDAILFPFVSKCIRFSIIFVGVVTVLELWDIKISLLITSLGLGGLALSLAAKDAAANIIAGVIIILEKPFNIGDWILAAGVEGTVEDISFRSTKIRTFSQEVVVVPNSKISDDSITNFSKRGKRRVSFSLGLMYKTPKEKIKVCVEKIEHMLSNHPGVNKDTILVSFDKFSDSSLDVFIYFFTDTTIWSEHLKVKQDINFKILDILEEEDVSCAFPSTSVYMETPIIQSSK